MEEDNIWAVVAVILLLVLCFVVTPYSPMYGEKPLPVEIDINLFAQYTLQHNTGLMLRYRNVLIPIVKEDPVYKEYDLDYITKYTEFYPIRITRHDNEVIFEISIEQSEEYITSTVNQQRLNDVCITLMEFHEDCYVSVWLVNDKDYEHVMYVSLNGKPDYYYLDPELDKETEPYEGIQ